MLPAVPSSATLRVHLLDVGREKYADSVLLEIGSDTVLIDGGNPSSNEKAGWHIGIQQQLADLLGQDKKHLHVALLVVTHAHQDHIGCLPELVDAGLRADWSLVVDPDLGWGTVGGQDATDVADARVRSVALALREASRPRLDDAAALDRFLTDAAELRPGYEAMLKTLAKNGRVVRHGVSSATALKKRFSKIGLDIVGPGKHQLELTAARVKVHTDAVVAAARQLFATDAAADAVDGYRRLLALSDAADAAKRLGNEVNLQSIVTAFTFGGRRLMFAGDMQLARPDSTNEVEGLVAALRKKIADAGPYDLVKLCHHGSDNGWDGDMFDELGKPPFIGICAGEESTKHPHKDVLDDLRSHKKETTWARTDRNGQVTFDLSKKKATVTKQRGKLNDAQPPQDEVVVSLPVAPAAPAGDLVEIVTRAPRGARVTITIDGAATVPSRPRAPLPRLDIAGGRALPRLLIVTNRDALADNIGTLESDNVLEALRGSHLVTFEVPRGADAATATRLVQRELRRLADRSGVLILGGYDVVPAQKVFCVPDAIRADVDLDGDEDRFTVWSDDGYVDLEGDDMPELPVSRIPDGRSAALVFAAVQARTPDRTIRRSGIRNDARKYADDVFALVPGDGEILRSGPAVLDRPPHLLDGDVVYLMLHGAYEDATTFWGGEPWWKYPVVAMANVPGRPGQVVFTGCCWGALTVDTPAGLVVEGRTVAPRTPESSLALRFLAGGATAFVGCTGAHYSPDPPYRSHGRPMHDAFWAAFRRGKPPAEALFEARKRFADEMPHGQREPQAQAQEVKILRQYACLGLGW
jgi:beta-lactamase superfamily II metal-dependent hydrolase